MLYNTVFVSNSMSKMQILLCYTLPCRYIYPDELICFRPKTFDF